MDLVTLFSQGVTAILANIIRLASSGLPEGESLFTTGHVIEMLVACSGACINSLHTAKLSSDSSHVWHYKSLFRSSAYITKALDVSIFSAMLDNCLALSKCVSGGIALTAGQGLNVVSILSSFVDPNRPCGCGEFDHLYRTALTFCAF